MDDTSAVSVTLSPLVTDLFAHVAEAPPDPILGLAAGFAKDSHEHRQNLGPGIYMDGAGRTRPLTVVQKAESRVLSADRREGYLPIEGTASFNKLVQELVFGADCPLVRAGNIITAQSLGGTGAVCVAAHLAKRFFPECEAAISAPTWPSHRTIFAELGFTVRDYPYYDSARYRVHFDGMMSALQALPKRSIVVLHASCHNPTGCDLSDAQWDELVSFFASSGHLALIDFAYQGFKTSIEHDAAPVRRFALSGIPFMVATSFSKNFSLYSQRVGALHVVCHSPSEATRMLSQIKQTIRAIYSNPPAFGSALVTEVLSDKTLRIEWEREVEEMRSRIISMRAKFVARLRSLGHDFSHVEQQAGMFSYTGLTPAQVERLKSDYGIYLVATGRIAVPALNDSNLEYVCSAIAAVMSQR